MAACRKRLYSELSEWEREAVDVILIFAFSVGFLLGFATLYIIQILLKKLGYLTRILMEHFAAKAEKRRQIESTASLALSMDLIDDTLSKISVKTI